MLAPAKTLLALASMAASAQAHSYMILPLPTWSSYATNSPSGNIDADTALTVPTGQSFYTSPSANTIAFTQAFDASKYETLREFVYATQVLETDATALCGFSVVGTKQELPEYVEWNQLTTSHEGPCEVWCDDTRVFHDTDCAANYTSDPALLPYDKSQCEGASMLQSIWLALHSPPWQVYTNCAALSGGSSSTTSSSTASVASSSAAATTEASSASDEDVETSNTSAYASTAESANSGGTAATSVLTVAPSTSGSGSTTSSASASTASASEETDSTATTTTTTETTTEAATETTGSSKCNVRSHRRRN